MKMKQANYDLPLKYYPIWIYIFKKEKLKVTEIVNMAQKSYTNQKGGFD